MLTTIVEQLDTLSFNFAEHGGVIHAHYKYKVLVKEYEGRRLKTQYYVHCKDMDDAILLCKELESIPSLEAILSCIDLLMSDN